jgi:hypothetical protein
MGNLLMSLTLKSRRGGSTDTEMEGIQSSYDNLLLRKLLRELAVEYPVPLDSYTEETVQKISYCHALQCEEFKREHTGIRTELISYQKGRIELELVCDVRLLSEGPGRYKVWSQIEAWFANHYLSRAKEFVAHVYTLKDSTHPIKSKSENALSPFPDIAKGMEKELPDVKCTEWRGWLGDPEELLFTPGFKKPEGIY